MRIIDANTGADVRPGQTFRNVNGTNTLLRVKEGILSAKALFNTERGPMWVPLTVRYMHPGFLFQKVGFIPS